MKWTHFAMLEGEVLGVTKTNVDDMKKWTDPQIRKFLGLEGDLGKGLGLDNDFAYKVIKAEGNYGEVYEATFGSKGLGLPRGLNNLYTNGGLCTPVHGTGARSTGRIDMVRRPSPASLCGAMVVAPARRGGCLA